MITRQRVLLSLIRQAGAPVSRLQLVKWAFLLHQENPAVSAPNFYQFVPYRFGPFSFTLYHELDSLVRDGILISPTEREIQLSPKIKLSIYALDTLKERQVQRFWSRFGKLSTAQLLQTVYSRNPWFTVKSDHPERRAALLPKAQCAVYMVGYEGMQVDGFLDLLLRSGIQSLLDVRNNPISRRFGFHKKTLSSLCEHLEIGYRHLPELGIPSQWRANLRAPSDFARLFSRYEQEILASHEDSIKESARIMAVSPTALLCQEADPKYCHRSRLAKRIAKLTEMEIRDLRASR